MCVERMISFSIVDDLESTTSDAAAVVGQPSRRSVRCVHRAELEDEEIVDAIRVEQLVAVLQVDDRNVQVRRASRLDIREEDDARLSELERTVQIRRAHLRRAVGV